MRAAVLFLVFNRPDLTSRVFEQIRAAQPPRLYVAADGPRKGRPGEPAICHKVRGIATAVDWPCEVSTLLRDENLGCKWAVSGGIDWFFENEEEGVILEDDCLPDPSFFKFCDELLARFRNDSRVMAIGGANVTSDAYPSMYSYFFSRYCLMWGWATWRRAWRLNDVAMKKWPELRNAGWLRTLGNRRVVFERSWRRTFDHSFDGTIDTWDFQWMFSSWLHGGYSLLPSVNLVRNLGFGDDATHTLRHDDFRSRLNNVAIQFPLRHPEYANICYNVERLIDEKWFQACWETELKIALLRLPVIKTLARLTRPLRKRLRRDTRL